MRLRLKKVFLCAIQLLLGYWCFVLYTYDSETSVKKSFTEVQTRDREIPKTVGPSHNPVNLTSTPKSVTKKLPLPVSHVNSHCANVTCPVHLAVENTWQLVAGQRLVLIFSAYFVDNGDVVIISARERFMKGDGYTCQFWFRSDDGKNVNMSENIARHKDLSEHHSKR